MLSRFFLPLFLLFLFHDWLVVTFELSHVFVFIFLEIECIVLFIFITGFNDSLGFVTRKVVTITEVLVTITVRIWIGGDNYGLLVTITVFLIKSWWQLRRRWWQLRLILNWWWQLRLIGDNFGVFKWSKLPFWVSFILSLMLPFVSFYQALSNLPVATFLLTFYLGMSAFRARFVDLCRLFLFLHFQILKLIPPLITLPPIVCSGSLKCLIH